jgi:hypothetical protein
VHHLSPPHSHKHQQQHEEQKLDTSTTQSAALQAHVRGLAKSAVADIRQKREVEDLAQAKAGVSKLEIAVASLQGAIKRKEHEEKERREEATELKAQLRQLTEAMEGLRLQVEKSLPTKKKTAATRKRKTATPAKEKRPTPAAARASAKRAKSLTRLQRGDNNTTHTHSRVGIDDPSSDTDSDAPRPTPTPTPTPTPLSLSLQTFISDNIRCRIYTVSHHQTDVVSKLYFITTTISSQLPSTTTIITAYRT